VLATRLNTPDTCILGLKSQFGKYEIIEPFLGPKETTKTKINI
jgi:hypothetical protein